jgi:mono/diheme cytochrome c family protein
MKFGMSVAMLSVTLAALLAVQGCAKKEPAETSQTASAPEATAPAEPSVAEPPAVESPAASGTTDGTTASVAEAPAAAAAGGAAAGEKVYKAFCVTCHGTTGKGDGPAAVALNPKPADFSAGAFKYDVNGNGTKGDIEDIKAIVHDGAAKHGGSPLMTPWPTIKPDQLQAVAEYVKSLHGA